MQCHGANVASPLAVQSILQRRGEQEVAQLRLGVGEGIIPGSPIDGGDGVTVRLGRDRHDSAALIRGREEEARQHVMADVVGSPLQLQALRSLETALLIQNARIVQQHVDAATIAAAVAPRARSERRPYLFGRPLDGAHIGQVEPLHPHPRPILRRDRSQRGHPRLDVPRAQDDVHPRPRPRQRRHGFEADAGIAPGHDGGSSLPPPVRGGRGEIARPSQFGDRVARGRFLPQPRRFGRAG
mmetsp:Transcript_46461/g.140739  ORF Transcript_46461/g.140739 Transcript_46461/m.140739 type:complete len:241 (+) Transcript_46461:572-1294(+)